MAIDVKGMDWVIAGKHHHLDGGPGALAAWNLYRSKGEAEGVLASATGERIVATYFPGTVAVMSFDDFQAARKAETIADAKLDEIDEEAFLSARNELPPQRWEEVDGVERFLCAEHTSYPFTYQYAARDGRYFACLVDATDTDTWITAAKIDALLAAKDDTPGSGPRP